MTDHQLHLLDALGDATSDSRPGPAQREAVRAVLAERAAYVRWAERFLAMYQDTTGLMAKATDELDAIYRANGGEP